MPQEHSSTVEQYADGVIPAALAAEICPELALAPLVPAEIYRYLGYPREGSPAPPMAEQIAQVVAEAQCCLRPRGAYSVYPVSSRTTHSLKLGDMCGASHLHSFYFFVSTEK